MALENRKKVVIIGGGVSGLTAGIYAQKAGFDSEIYEMHSMLGGQCTGWKRNGFLIDNCITWLTCAAPKYPMYTMWKDIGFLADSKGNEIPVHQHDFFYSSELDGKKVTLWRALSRAEKELVSIAPEDEKRIRHFIKDVKTAQKLQPPYLAPLSMMKLIDLIKLGLKMIPIGILYLKYCRTSLVDFARRFKNPLLKKMILDYVPVNHLAYVLVCAYAAISSGGGCVPEGGSTKVIERMEEIYKLNGGKVFLNSNVKNIIIEGNKATGIQLDNGNNISGDFVIPTCDPFHLFTSILDKKYMPRQFKYAFSNSDKYELDSSFHVAYEYDGQADEINDCTYFDCDEINVGLRKIERLNVKNYSYDESFVPAGKNLIQVRIFQDEADYKYWKQLYETDKKQYKHRKEEISGLILKAVEKQYPSAKGKLKLLDVWTPYTYTHFVNAYCGCFMGFVLTKNGKFLTLSGVLKGLKNVFLAGQWLSSPHGIPIAVTYGKFAVQRILKSLHKPYYFDS